MREVDLVRDHPATRSELLANVMAENGFSSNEITRCIGILSIIFTWQFVKRGALSLRRLMAIMHLTSNSPLWQMLEKLEAIEFIKRIPLVGRSKAVVLTEKALLRNYGKKSSENNSNIKPKICQCTNKKNGKMRSWQAEYFKALELYLAKSDDWNKKEWMVYTALKYFARNAQAFNSQQPCTGMILSKIIKRSEPTALTLLSDMEKKGMISRVAAKDRYKRGVGMDIVLTDFPLRWLEDFEKKSNNVK